MYDGKTWGWGVAVAYIYIYIYMCMCIYIYIVCIYIYIIDKTNLLLGPRSPAKSTILPRQAPFGRKLAMGAGSGSFCVLGRYSLPDLGIAYDSLVDPKNTFNISLLDIQTSTYLAEAI